MKLRKRQKSQTTQTEVLESVSVALPALMRSYKVQKKAAKVGVDVSDANAALDQIIARAQELKQTLSKQQDSNLLEHQVGDLLFSAVNVARKCEVEPEYSLTNACNRFIIYFLLLLRNILRKTIMLVRPNASGVKLYLAAGDNRTILTMRFIKISGVKNNE